MGEIRIARLGRYPRLFHFHQNRRTIQEILPPDGALSELRVTLHSGDLVLFTQRGVVSHAGIYVGQNRFVHAPSTGGDVRLDYLSSKYWAAQQVAFRRP